MKNTNNSFNLSQGTLTLNGLPILSEIPNNVSFNPFSQICTSSSHAPSYLLQKSHSLSHKGGFLGFTQDTPSDRLLNSLGKFVDRNFLSVFRFKTWWSTMWVGTSGSDLQMESQWVMLEVPETGCYVLVLPLIEGKFRSAIHPGAYGHVMICAESGSTQVTASAFSSILYVHVSDNPYSLMKEAYTVVRVHLDSFRLLEEKSVPGLVDRFGWCTWDAFYLTVDPVGIWHGLNEFGGGGVPPRFVIIDDGWQSISADGEEPCQDAKNLVLCGSQMTTRLYRFTECDKFKKYKAGTMLAENAPWFDPKRPKMLIAKAIQVEHAEKARDKAIKSGNKNLSEFESKIEILKQELDEMFGGEIEANGISTIENHVNCGFDGFGMKAFTKDLRTKFKGLDDVYVWHALCGAWGGVRPGTTHLESKIIPVKVSPGLDATMEDLAVVKITEGGIGLVRTDQAADYFESMYSYLAGAGITGVKVDVIHSLEYVCEEYGGRVELARAYYDGLSKSLAKNFNGTGLIASMQQCNDFFFLGTKQISIGRVGDDFWFQDPNGDPMGVYWLQGVHMVHCAYNSMWMGQMIQPDWDMFQSDHPSAEFHAGSRAICGGPVYVSDSVGGHNFDVIKKLVFPDGSIPRCQHFALPTRDCLFRNPLFDNKTALKIWNLNKFGGVVGAFNCQGAGWDSKERRIRGFPECYKPVSVSVHVTDIEWDQKKETVEMGDAENYVVYLTESKTLYCINSTSTPKGFTIQPTSFEIFSFVPIKNLSPEVHFAPIGLTDMLNCGGTIQGVEYSDEGESEISAEIKVKGGGKFLAYSSSLPKKCCVNGVKVDFEWLDDCSLTVSLPWVEESGGISVLGFVF